MVRVAAIMHYYYSSAQKFGNKRTACLVPRVCSRVWQKCQEVNPGTSCSFKPRNLGVVLETSAQ